MAFVATLASTVTSVVSYRRTVTVTYTLTGVTSGATVTDDEVAIPFPTHGRVTLLEVVQTAGAPATFQPRVGTAAGYADASIDDCYTAGAAAAHQRLTDVGPMVSPTDVLAVRPGANGNCDAKLRVTWTEGHAA